MSTYVFSDIHAQYDLWKQIKNFIKPEDKVFCLGDCVDRGEIGFEILNEVMNTPNIILLRGNHEDFIDSIGSTIIEYDAKENEDFWFINREVRLWLKNGAKKTINAFLKLTKDKRKELIKKIRQLPTHAEYTNINGEKFYLTHAGRQPDTKEILDMYTGDIPINNYIWDRKHILDLKWEGKDNEYCIHGHTPVLYMKYFMHPMVEHPQSKFKIFKYCNNHKIDIDLGSFVTHKICLLNLDTLEPIYFKDRNISSEQWESIINGIE